MKAGMKNGTTTRLSLTLLTTHCIQSSLEPPAALARWVFQETPVAWVQLLTMRD
jgi:hypothetical protein